MPVFVRPYHVKPSGPELHIQAPGLRPVVYKQITIYGLAVKNLKYFFELANCCFTFRLEIILCQENRILNRSIK